MWPPYRENNRMDEKYHDFLTNPKFSIVARLLSPAVLCESVLSFGIKYILRDPNERGTMKSVWFHEI